MRVASHIAREGVCNFVRGDARFRNSINLDAIAGSENKDFIAAQKVSPFPLRPRSNVTLPSLYARGVMTDADAENAHQVGRVSDTKFMAQRTETAAVKARMQSAAMRFGARR